MSFPTNDAHRRFIEMTEKANAANTGVKVMASIGGYDNSEMFLYILRNTTRRRTFINSIASLILKHNLDGVEIHWVWPSGKREKEIYCSLIKEVREKLTTMVCENCEKYILTIPLPPVIFDMQNSFDLEFFVQYVDFFNVISFEYYGVWDASDGIYVGPNAPLFGGKRGNVDDTMKYYTCKLMDPSKLTMGIPFYGKTWKNVKEEINQTEYEEICSMQKCRTNDTFQPSNIWRMVSLMNGKPEGSDIEYGELIRDQWNLTSTSWDKQSKSEYIWDRKRRTMSILETMRTVTAKLKYAYDFNLGGVSGFTVDMDNESSLLELLSFVDLCSRSPIKEVKYNCQNVLKFNEYEHHDRPWTRKRVSKYVAVSVVVLLVCGIVAFGLSTVFFYFLDGSDDTRYPIPLPPAAKCGKRIIGYYSGWERRTISENQVSKLTHAIFVAVRMYQNGQIGFHNSEYSGRFFDMKKKARRVNSDIKVMIGVGGKGNSQFYSSIFADTQKRKTFVKSISEFLSTHKVDGVEIDWTYPFADKVDKNTTVIFFKELRQSLKDLEHKKGVKTPYLISMLTPQIIWNQLDGYDLKGILDHADFLNLISYEYYSPWNVKEGAYTGPLAPIYGGKRGNIDDTMKVHTCQTRKPNQVILGVPLYGKFWRNVKEKPINQTETMCKEESCRIEDPVDISDIWRIAEKKKGKGFGGFISWNERESDDVGVIWNKTEEKWHNISKSAYIWRPEDRILITYENKRTLQEKIKYAIEKNLGGINIWSLNMDDEQDSALSLISSAELCDGKKKNEIMYKC
ncbi:hypothetical protein GCK72_005177 [Caenorhabditis remanei]|uniref:GH18 domain-containing protein n=1 Tax=Caenorhabditis remanei TaxID=31234 RepID=A0A6A5HD50_CAERE|nr:hypothetical protein GCK72_005177 [Caenorhabditis remanei]KAF1765225.1 hypothetical protein GCK72_005177 [Caenorhabditis remanei]